MIPIKRGTVVNVKIKGLNVSDERYFSSGQKLTRYLKYLKKIYKTELKIEFKTYILN